MIYLYYILAFFVGGCFASCGNCVNFRIHRHKDWVRDRSVCEGCGKPLAWYELVPVVSCLVLRGTCPKCGYHFGYFHAGTEAAMGIAAVILCLGRDPASMVVRVLSFGIAFLLCEIALSYLDRFRGK